MTVVLCIINYFKNLMRSKIMVLILKKYYIFGVKQILSNTKESNFQTPFSCL